MLHSDGIDSLQNELNVSGVLLNEENTQNIKILNDKIFSMELDYVKLNEVRTEKGNLGDLGLTLLCSEGLGKLPAIFEEREHRNLWDS